MILSPSAEARTPTAFGETVDPRRDLLTTIVERTQFAMQPIVNIESGLIHGYEVLLRNHLAAGFESLPALLDTVGTRGIAGALDRALLAKAIRIFATMPQDGASRLFFNVHPMGLAQLSDLAAEAIVTAHANSMDVERICLEISERSELADDQAAAISFRRLHAAGLKVALDDFGEGYSRLKLLHNRDADYVKFDRFFVHGIAADARKQVLVSDMLSSLRAFGITTVAEGVETRADLRVCQSLGFHLIQGYVLCRPTVDIETLPRHFNIVRAARRPTVRERETDRALLRPRLKHPLELTEETSLGAARNRCAAEAPAPAVVLDGAGQPAGILLETDLRPAGRPNPAQPALASARVGDVARRCPVVDIHSRIEQILQVFVESESPAGMLVTENGRYAGLLDADGLLRALNDKFLDAARERDPLTRLPGRGQVYDRITAAVMATEEEWTLVHFDFDDLTGFNREHGFALGDRALRLFADLLERRFAGGGAFVGHLGSDDFFLAVKDADFTELSTMTYLLRRRFASDVLSFQHGKDANGAARAGLTCTAAMLMLKADRSRMTREEVLEIFEQAKTKAKVEGGFAFDSIG
jgi:EAL domain-containing protein (putative c-di-GMP-specific phosphodiesterase class I)/GGDEF domain-containing protein